MSVTAVESRREEYSRATRAALIAAGRQTFAAEGYRATGIDAISRAARVTRGAFYHHFADKAALFDAVVSAMQHEAAAAVQDATRALHGPRERLEAGIDAYLDVCLQAEYRRLVMQEAPAVLGPERCREMEDATVTALLGATLKALARDGLIIAGDLGVLTRMMDAMVCAVALMLPTDGESGRVRAVGRDLIGRFMDALRPPA